MSKIMIELNPQQINEAVENLSNVQKLILMERLEKETLALRWKKILKGIDARLKKFPISKAEVIEEIQAYRRQKHAQGRN